MSEKEPKIRIRVAALILREGRILLAEHEKGGRRYWLLPGGGVEFGESLEEALQRELMEEAGLEIEVGDLLWTLDSIPPDKHRHVLNLIFRAEALSDQLIPVQEKVLQGVKWMPLEDFPSLTLYPNTKKEILAYLDSGGIEAINLGVRWGD
ncbi:MAG: NUDIX domain-containing protein [Candidatus Omnitrophica bacterium]|nr:NUDIX domain-containing protein [Candidatus Omnitrophota bacterium]